MSNILVDIVDDVVVKPSKLKLILKWVISISISLIGAAFVFGQIQIARLNRLENLERALGENTKATNELKEEMRSGFIKIDNRIDKVYTDGYNAFYEYQQYNKKQLELIIDYGNKDNEMLKRILEITTIESTRRIENQLEQAKQQSNLVENVETKPNPNYSIVARPVTPQQQKNNNYINLLYTINVETRDTTFRLIGATKEYINSIDRNRYSVGQMTQSSENPNLFDVYYINKK